MALAFMLNPRGGKKKRAKRRVKRRAPKRRICTKKRQAAKRPCRTVKQKAIMARARKASRRATSRDRVVVGGGGTTEAALALMSHNLGLATSNPRRGRKSKGGRKMAATKRKRRKSTKRSRAGKKAWRTRLRRYSKKRSSVGRRGYKNNPRKRRRNAWRDDTAGHRKAAKKGWRKRRKNPRGRRRNSMYSGRLYANPKRRRNSSHRRRNPFGLSGVTGSITRSLTDPKTLIQFAVGAAGASVSGLLGSWISGKIAGFAPATFADPKGMASNLLQAASSIAAGILVASFLPSQYKAAWVLGSGVVAVNPIVSGFIAPALAPVSSALGITGLAGPRGGIGGWISAAEIYGTRGMGSWITAQQMPGLGVRGLRGGNYTNQPGMQSAFTM